jgi:hypothetical protein
MGFHEGKSWFESQSDLEALWIVEEDGELKWRMTSGMETMFTIER